MFAFTRLRVNSLCRNIALTVRACRLIEYCSLKNITKGVCDNLQCLALIRMLTYWSIIVLLLVTWCSANFFCFFFFRLRYRIRVWGFF